jgi:hypothetical protein
MDTVYEARGRRALFEPRERPRDTFVVLGFAAALLFTIWYFTGI